MEYIFGILDIGVGFIIPAICSLSLITSGKKEKVDEESKLKWVSYWITLGLLYLAVFPVIGFLAESMTTFLYGFQTLILAFLILPQTNGSAKIGGHYVHLVKNWKSISESVKEMIAAKVQSLNK